MKYLKMLFVGFVLFLSTMWTMSLSSCEIQDLQDEDIIEYASLTIKTDSDSESRSLLISTITRALVTITSSDMEEEYSDYVDVSDGSGEFTIDKVQVGKNRLITVQAYSKSALLENICISAVTDIISGSDNEVSVSWDTIALGNVYKELLSLGVDIASLSDSEDSSIKNAIPSDTEALLVDSASIASDFKNKSLKSSSNYVLKTGNVTFSYSGLDSFTAILNEPYSDIMTGCNSSKSVTISGAAPGTWILYILDSEGNIEKAVKGVKIASSETTKLGELYTSDSSDSNEESTSDSYDESTFENKLYINLAETSSWSSTENGTYYNITTTKATVGDSIKVQYTKDDDGNSTGLIEINAKKSSASTAFYFTGTLTTGGIKIQTNGSDDVLVYLNGVNISSSNYPCIDITKGSKAYVTLSGTNKLTDGRSYGIGYGEEYSTTSGTYTDDDGNTVEYTVSKEVVQEGSDNGGALYCKGDLVFDGTGSLTITEGYKHCICSKGFIQVESGTFNLISNSKNGFDARYGFTQNGGDINFDGNGAINVSTSSIKDEYYVKKANGIAVDGIISSTNNGWIKINAGTFTADITYGKGMNAKWDSSEDTDTDGTTGTPDPSIYISGGTISIVTTGTGYTGDDTKSKKYYYYDANGEYHYENFACAAEGIESNKYINISGGTISIVADDDGMNASLTGGEVNISGGSIYVYASGGDGIDSNGNIKISGGTIVSIAPTGSEDALDCGDGGYSTTITGGLIAAASGSSSATLSASNTMAINYGSSSSSSFGGNMGGPGQSSSSSSSVSISGCTFVVTNSSGTNLYTFTCPTVSSSSSSGMGGGGSSGLSILAMVSPNFCNVGTCTLSVYSSPSISGGQSYKGLYTSLPTVSGTASTTKSVSLSSSSGSVSAK